MRDQLESLIEDCETCARAYEEKPGLVQPSTIVDLYRGIARLAAIVKADKVEG